MANLAFLYYEDKDKNENKIYIYKKINGYFLCSEKDKLENAFNEGDETGIGRIEFIDCDTVMKAEPQPIIDEERNDFFNQTIV